MSLSSTKPEILADQGDSIGAHLRRIRKARGLKQIEAAALMSVNQHTIVDWETEVKQPGVRLYPTILDFLGYEPWPKPQALPEQLIAERRRRGMSSGEAADEIGVDQGTYLRWEDGRTRPLHRASCRVAAFLKVRTLGSKAKRGRL